MKEYLIKIILQFLIRNGAFLKIAPRQGRSYSDGFEIINRSTETHHILVLSEEQ